MGILPLLPALCQTAASGALARYRKTLHFVPDPPKEGLVTRLASTRILNLRMHHTVPGFFQPLTDDRMAEEAGHYGNISLDCARVALATGFVFMWG